MAEDVDQDYEAFLKALGRRIKEFRKERKLSLRDMVVKHGYHDSQWRRIERLGAVNMHSLLRIARAFETSLSILLDGLGEYPDHAAEKIKKTKDLTRRTIAEKTKSI
jgi:transcriptional regulator with XRE-family HTH domain